GIVRTMKMAVGTLLLSLVASSAVGAGPMAAGDRARVRAIAEKMLAPTELDVWMLGAGVWAAARPGKHGLGDFESVATEAKRVLGVGAEPPPRALRSPDDARWRMSLDDTAEVLAAAAHARMGERAAGLVELSLRLAALPDTLEAEPVWLAR